MTRAIRFGMISSLSVSIITACTKHEMAEPLDHEPKSDYGVKSAPSTPAPTHHWVEDDQLRQVMKKLGAASASRWPSALPDDPEVVISKADQDVAYENAAKLASSLADSAYRIPGTIAASHMTDADRREFTGIAKGLQDQARLLSAAARRRNVEDMQRQLDAIRASCISCHTRFKDISGDLPPRA